MKKVMKYMMMLLAIAVMGLSLQAWGATDAAAAAPAAVEAAADADIDLGESLMNFVEQSGISGIINDWRVLVMLIISCVLLYLAIVKQFEPLLLLPIAFGMLVTNLPGANMYHPELFAEGHVHWDLFADANNIGSISDADSCHRMSERMRMQAREIILLSEFA